MKKITNKTTMSLQLYLSASFFVVICSFSLLATAQSNQPQKVDSFTIVTPSWPNWTNLDETGFYFDLAHSIFDQEGIGFTVKFQPYLRAKLSVRDNQADAMFAVYKKTNTSSMLTPDYPIDVGQTIVAFPAELTWQGTESLKDQKIIVPRSYYEEFPLNINIKTMGVNGTEAGFLMLLAKRADYLITDKDEFLDLVKRHNIDENRFRTEVLVNANLYMGFSNNEKGQQLLTIFNKNMPELIANGSIEKLYKKWQLELNLLAPSLQTSSY